MNQSNRKSQRGFSLIELVIVMVIVSLAASALYVPLLVIMNNIVYDRWRNDLVDSSRVAFERSVFEIRNVSDEFKVIFVGEDRFTFRNTQANKRSIWEADLGNDLHTLRMLIDSTYYPLTDFVVPTSVAIRVYN